MANQRVVIVGGGFGGLTTALALRRHSLEITVIDRNNHHLFQPLLYQVVTAGLAPSEITAPIRRVLKGQQNVRVVMAEVTSIDLSAKNVHTDREDYAFDYLVIATGSCYNYFDHDEWADCTLNLKSIADAIHIRDKILAAFEQAELETDPGRRTALQTFVLIGAGPTGVELAGAIAELSRKALAGNFRNIDPRSARILLVEAGPRILPAFSESLSDRAHKALSRLGVEVRTEGKVSEITPDGMIVDGERIASGAVIWAAGVKATELATGLGVATDRNGRVKVESDLSIPEHSAVFVIGDACGLEQNGKPLPGLAPVAIQQGSYVASVIGARSQGQLFSTPFHYRDKGNLATVGRSFGIAEFGRFGISGFFAWVVWLVVHIYFLIGFRNRIAVMLEWVWSYFTFDRGVRLIVRPHSPPKHATVE